MLLSGRKDLVPHALQLLPASKVMMMMMIFTRMMMMMMMIMTMTKDNDDDDVDPGEHSNASGVDSSHARLSQGGCCRGELHHQPSS